MAKDLLKAIERSQFSFKKLLRMLKLIMGFFSRFPKLQGRILANLEAVPCRTPMGAGASRMEVWDPEENLKNSQIQGGITQTSKWQQNNSKPQVKLSEIMFKTSAKRGVRCMIRKIFILRSQCMCRHQTLCIGLTRENNSKS